MLSKESLKIFWHSERALRLRKILFNSLAVFRFVYFLKSELTLSLISGCF